MLNEKNIDDIIGQLLSLGLGPDLEYQLRANVCLQPSDFRISHRQIKDLDTMNCVFYFERKENEYFCRYYEAWLRKNISLPSITINDVDLNELQERMRGIDWNMGFTNNSDNSIQIDNKSIWQREGTIESIVTDLKQLATTPEGLHLAERLKMKFWMDTPLISLIPNINTLRNQYEISQRFYFFEGEDHISLDEAYRFLSHRWRERQLNTKKKQTENASGSENERSSFGTPKENKLLTKRRSNKGRQLKH